MDYSKPLKIDLGKLKEYFNPFVSRTWVKVDKPVTQNEVTNVLKENYLISPDVPKKMYLIWDESTKQEHVGRIAWLVKHYSDNYPIDIDFGIADFGGWSSKEIVDGNHRLAAAIYLNKPYIMANVSGSESIIDQFAYKKHQHGGPISDRNTIDLINSKTFYRYYPAHANPFTISYEAKNKYGFGIYFLDNPLYYANLYSPACLVSIKPNVKNPKIYEADKNNSIPNQKYLKDFFNHVHTNRNANSRNDFNEHLLAQGHDSVVVYEPRGIYLLLLKDCPYIYKVLSDEQYRQGGIVGSAWQKAISWLSSPI